MPTREVWRQTFVINHPDNGPRDLEYKTTQYFKCKGCKERFGVNIEIRGMSKERYERYVKKETQNLMMSGGIDYKSTWDISKEHQENFSGLCSSCLADAANRYAGSSTSG
jgi:hypothetical protein